MEALRCPADDANVDSLSGGEKRRVAICRLLLEAPDMLLLDEPSTGVDPGARLSFWRYLEALRRSEGVTVLLTTHLLDEADRCDRLAILDGGRLIREGTPTDLKAEIGEDIVTLASSAPEAIATVLQDEFGVADIRLGRRKIRFGHPQASHWIGRLTQRFEEQVESVKVSRPSLEDVFLHHAGHGFETEDTAWDAIPHATS